MNRYYVIWLNGKPEILTGTDLLSILNELNKSKNDIQYYEELK